MIITRAINTETVDGQDSGWCGSIEPFGSIEIPLSGSIEIPLK